MKKIHRFIGDFDLNKDIIQIEEKDLVKQFFKVLKFKVGENIILCDGTMHEATCEVLKLDNKQTLLKILSRMVPDIEPKVRVTLFCAVLKRENFELVVQKATEVGVAEIVPIITKRTIKQNIKLDRLRVIAKEAAEQCGRTVLPIIHEVRKFDKSVDDATLLAQNYFFVAPTHIVANR